ncbi:hypothetical protein [Egicoccus sp. AB-alg2]|uniref:hypothetical protein n=1 Tax=Egicoccus sp. AB-alg2 TaxID=3242693 RepID=UPI00359D599E
MRKRWRAMSGGSKGAFSGLLLGIASFILLLATGGIQADAASAIAAVLALLLYTVVGGFIGHWASKANRWIEERFPDRGFPARVKAERLEIGARFLAQGGASFVLLVFSIWALASIDDLDGALRAGEGAAGGDLLLAALGIPAGVKALFGAAQLAADIGAEQWRNEAARYRRQAEIQEAKEQP